LTISTKDLWTLEELRHIGQIEEQISGVRRAIIDSRLAEPGDLFIALPGDPGPRFNASYRSDVDGHDFVAAAAARGAVAAMVHRAVSVPPGFGRLQVEDTYDGLWALGRAARARLACDVIAVTGSSGKTTAKQFLAHALAAYAPPGSLNNHIGVPLSLSNAPRDSQCGVFEIGTNHVGEIEPLARLTAPTLAIVLNVHSAHIENFPSREALFQEKISIFNALEDKSNAISEDLMALDFGHSYGYSATADARVVSVSGDLAEIKLFKQRLKARVPGGGQHRAGTVAATLLAAKMLDIPLVRGLDLPETLIPAGRGQRLVADGVVIIDESYNANPASMLATLQALAARPQSGRSWALVGEMLELGAAAEQAHLDLIPALQLFDRCLCIGEGTRALAAELDAQWFGNAGQDLIEMLIAELQPGDQILVKGSNRVFWRDDFVSRLQAALDERSV
jgi:UDP-N-acetylmuramoyl-tripeptide--D-alanyl-D-alanine ligase